MPANDFWVVMEKTQIFRYLIVIKDQNYEFDNYYSWSLKICRYVDIILAVVVHVQKIQKLYLWGFVFLLVIIICSCLYIHIFFFCKGEEPRYVTATYAVSLKDFRLPSHNIIEKIGKNREKKVNIRHWRIQKSCTVDRRPALLNRVEYSRYVCVCMGIIWRVRCGRQGWWGSTVLRTTTYNSSSGSSPQRKTIESRNDTFE